MYNVGDKVVISEEGWRYFNTQKDFNPAIAAEGAIYGTINSIETRHGEPEYAVIWNTARRCVYLEKEIELYESIETQLTIYNLFIGLDRLEKKINKNKLINN